MNSSAFFKYDNTLEGLFTVIFELYKSIERISIIPRKEQLNMLGNDNFIATNEDESDRVVNSLVKNFGKDFMRRVMYVYSTPVTEKEDIIARTIKGMFLFGEGYLFSSEKVPSEFRRLNKRVGAENHSYKGLLRFRELKDGMLFAEFRPENDILMFLAPHFIRRMPSERFAIYDSLRNNCLMYENGEVKFLTVDSLDIKESNEEEFFKKAWKKFYNSVGIEKRKNEKLMISNMPKRYWEFLPEKEEL